MSINSINSFQNATLQFYTNNGKIEDQDINSIYLSALQTYGESDLVEEPALKERVKKITFADYAITLPEGTCEIGAFLYTHRENFNQMINGCFQYLTLQKNANEEKKHLAASFVQTFVQDILDIYVYHKDDREAYIESRIDDLKARFLTIENYMKENALVSENQGDDFDNEILIDYSEFQALKGCFNCNEWLSLFENADGVDNISVFLNKLVDKILTSEEFAKRAEESDRKFLEKHQNTLKNITNEDVRSLYLSTLPSDQLDRLGRLTTGKGEVSCYIKNKIQEIKEHNKTVTDISGIALGLFLGGALLSMDLYLKSLFRGSF